MLMTKINLLLHAYLDGLSAFQLVCIFHWKFDILAVQRRAVVDSYNFHIPISGFITGV